MSRPALKVRNLSVAFRSADGSGRVVDDVSFDIMPGEVVGLVGESGCGKTVTSRALLGLLPPRSARTESRRLELAGQELSALTPHQWRAIRGKRMATIFQDPSTAFDPVYTIGSQISRVIGRNNERRGEVRERALQALETCGFRQPGEVHDAYPHQLSGGMRQLAMIAMAMAVCPEVLIADEPTTALDVTTQSLVIRQLARLRQRHGTSVLLVTHDLGVAAQICDRAMVMYCGRIVEQSSYEQLYRHPRHPYTAGLLAAIPRVSEAQTAWVQPIPGRVPAIKERGAGCHFAERCPLADTECRARFPALARRGASLVACHHPLEAR